jgi:hypothetical protein
MSNQYIFFFLFFLINNHAFAQEYKPIDTADFAQRKAFLDGYTIMNEYYLKGLKRKNPGNTGKELAKNYSEFQVQLKNEMVDSTHKCNRV